MVVWRKFDDTADSSAWDRLLSCFEDPHVYQTCGWGESQKATGWSPERFCAYADDGSVEAATQILVKRFPAGIKIAWSPGGPLLRSYKIGSQAIADILAALVRELEACFRGRFYIRFDCHTPFQSDITFGFERVLARPRFNLNSRYSLRFNLAEPLETLKNRFSRHHRRNIKAGRENDIRWRSGNDAVLIEDLTRLHREMLKIKNDRSIKIDLKKIPPICEALGDNAVIFTGYANDEAVVSCLVLVFGGKVFYRAAAAGAEGRKLRASHLMILRLLEYLKNAGCSWLDFGGLDVNETTPQGVNFFKQGFGGELVEYMGEWEWSNCEWLRWAVNLAIGVKHFAGYRIGK